MKEDKAQVASTNQCAVPVESGNSALFSEPYGVSGLQHLLHNSDKSRPHQSESNNIPPVQVETSKTHSQFTFGGEFLSSLEDSVEPSLTDVNFYPVIKGIAKRDPNRNYKQKLPDKHTQHKLASQKIAFIRQTNARESRENSPNHEEISEHLTEAERYSKVRERIFLEEQKSANVTTGSLDMETNYSHQEIPFFGDFTCEEREEN